MLVNCAAYRGGQKLKDIPIEQVSDYLAAGDSFVWVAYKDPSDTELDQIREEFNLHPLAIEDVRKGNQRPKLEEYGPVLFVVLHTVEVDTAGELVCGEVDLFAGPNFVVSIRKRTSQGFVNVRERSEHEPELLNHGAGFVLYAIMDTVVDRYFPVVEALENQLEHIEEKIFSGSNSARATIEEVYALKRKLMTVQHATSPLLEAVGKLHGGRVPQICAAMQEYFRDVSDHVLRVNKAIDSLREMSTTAIQVNLSLISLSESEVTKKLASYGALFAVPTSIAGIYGMNFKFMPELEWIWGYPVALSLIVLADVLLWLRFRKAGWL